MIVLDFDMGTLLVSIDCCLTVLGSSGFVCDRGLTPVVSPLRYDTSLIVILLSRCNFDERLIVVRDVECRRGSGGLLS